LLPEVIVRFAALRLQEQKDAFGQAKPLPWWPGCARARYSAELRRCFESDMLISRALGRCRLPDGTATFVTRCSSGRDTEDNVAEVEMLGQIEGPIEGYVTVIVRARAQAGELVPRHTHPAIESTYILEGEETVMIDGFPDKLCKAGDWFQVPPRVAHSVQIGPNGAAMVGNYVIPKGEPLSTQA
jgi:quercetin dioxygenase-like cupin family protein